MMLSERIFCWFLLTCGGFSRNGAETLAARDSVEIEFVSAGRSQIGDGHLAGASLHGQRLGFAFSVLVLDLERVKAPSGDGPGETRRIAGDIRD